VKVILRKNVEKLGQVGDVLKVKDGFARNYLIPKGLALNATALNLTLVEVFKKSKAATLEGEKSEAAALAKKLESASFTLAVEANEEDTLYGSVTSQEVARLLEAEGYKIDEKNIFVDEPVKSLGIYAVKIKLHPDIETQIKVWIVKK